ncbi:MAG: RNA polymerase sigma factor RpoD/SigA [Nanoarchaeota archaeon]|nr:RNA polymerase sigma factor RpoD/SigA [Nanoarchaeota archaeon]
MSKSNGTSRSEGYAATKGTYQFYDSGFQPDSDLETEIIPYLIERLGTKLLKRPSKIKQFSRLEVKKGYYSLEDLAKTLGISEEEACVLASTGVIDVNYKNNHENPIKEADITLDKRESSYLLERVLSGTLLDLVNKGETKSVRTILRTRNHRKGANYSSTLVDIYFNDIEYSGGISQEMEVALARRIKLGDEEARACLIENNLRFVVSVAKEYQNNGLSLIELISAGNIGLTTAAERFNEERGFKFISYAVWWVRQSILQTLGEQTRTVRIPMNRIDLLRSRNKIVSQIENEGVSSDSIDIISEELGIDEETAIELEGLSKQIVRLDKPLNEAEDDETIGSRFADHQPRIDEQIILDDLTESVEEVLSGLPEREEKINRMYFGIGGEEPMILEEIGFHFSLTRERVRQLKERALRRLKHPSRSDRLKTYTNV